jgi:hypothetical protein
MLRKTRRIEMNKLRMMLCLAAVGAAALAGSRLIADSGREHSFRARLSGFQEVPTVSTTGSGEFRAKLDSSESSLSYELEYSGLQGGPAAAAHVHLGARGTNGGVMFFLCGGGGKPVCPATAGSVSGTVTAADIIGPAGQGIAPGEFAEVLRAMRSGVAYANVHTPPTWPGGEIRGQINNDSH